MAIFDFLSMAFPRHEVIRKFRDLQDVLNEHLVFLLMAPDNPAYNHWKGELGGWLRALATKKIKGDKYLSQKVIFKFLYKEPFENVGGNRDYFEILDNMKNLNVDLTPEFVESLEIRLKKAHELIAKSLSAGKMNLKILDEILNV